jgi:hypothetical protein
MSVHVSVESNGAESPAVAGYTLNSATFALISLNPLTAMKKLK